VTGSASLSADELTWLARIERAGAAPPDATARRLREAGLLQDTARGPRITPQGVAALAEARRRGVDV